MERLQLIHVDDSLTALKLLSKQVEVIRPDIEVQSYLSIAEVCDALSARLESAPDPASAIPYLVVTDINLPARRGTSLISWLRRHSLLHQTPIVVLSAASAAAHDTFAATHGVIRWISKPASSADITGVFRERERMSESIKLRSSLERDFADSGIQALDGMLLTLDKGGDTAALFAALHSFKGEAAALLFPDLSEVAHAAEEFVARTREAGYRNLDHLGGPVREAIGYLRMQLQRFGMRRADLVLEEPPPLLLYGLEALGKNLPPPPVSSTSPSERTLRPGPVSWDLPDLGIDIPSFERLQEKVRTVLKRSARISEKVRTVTATPASSDSLTELNQLVKKLDNDCMEMTATLVAHFTVRGERIIAFIQTVVSEVSRFAGRRAALELDINPELEIDQAVFGSLKTIFVHLVRNALDHGIESAEERLKVGKPPAGMIRVTIRPDRRFRYRIIFEDDGRGIDVEHLRREAARRGIKVDGSESSDQEALELIFVDELTTKDAVTTISGRGMGMGAIRRMIEAREGTIAVSSQAGAGTRFEITLTKVLKLQ